MKVIKLTQPNGEVILVNMDNVTYMMPAGSDTIIHFNGGERSKLIVKEAISDIDRLAPN